MVKKSRLGVPKEERGRSGMDGHFFFLMKTVIFRMYGPSCTAQGNVYDWVTLLHNRTRNTVNQLYFNNNNNLKS